jgi:hypothetical protein
MALQVSTFESVHVLAAVGKIWVISGLDAASARDKLGGELVGKK